jgi:hypothetical protein
MAAGLLIARVHQRRYVGLLEEAARIMEEGLAL